MRLHAGPDRSPVRFLSPRAGGGKWTSKNSALDPGWVGPTYTKTRGQATGSNVCDPFRGQKLTPVRGGDPPRGPVWVEAIMKRQDVQSNALGISR